MSLKSLLTDVPHSITRFRDIVQERYDVPPSKLTQHWYECIALAQAEERERARRTITNPEEWQAERDRLRANFQAALGPFPPLQVEVIDKGRVETKDLEVRKILFSSSQDNWVPANVFLPRNCPGPLPAIINACGHNDAGKIGYAARAAMLALNGYVVLTFDLIGMGERHVVPPNLTRYCASTQHNIIGSKMVLAGCSLGWFMVQETMAAVSVLQAVPEVDPERIGITGSSGGGWLSVHAAALEERIKVVVPAASVRSYRHGVQADDAEQTLFAMQRLGLDFPDLMGLLICPRPLFIIANTRDIWSVESTEYAFAETARLYQMLGHGDRVGIRVWDRGHVYEDDQLTEALQWFNTWLKENPDAPVVTEVGHESLPDVDDLLVSPSGNIYEDLYKTPSRVFWDFAKEKLCSEKNLDGFLAFLKRSLTVTDDTGWAELDRFTLEVGTGKRICYSPEEGILLPVEIFMPDQPQGIIILLDETDRREDLDWQMECVHQGVAVLRPDLRGWGEMSPEEEYADWEGWSRNLYDSRWRELHALALMTGRDLVLDRARDLIALLRIAEETAPGHGITVWGKREGALIALLAGLVDPRIRKLILERYLCSYSDVMECDLPLCRVDGYLHGLLTWGVDIPDLLAAYTGELAMKNPLNALLQPVS